METVKSYKSETMVTWFLVAVLAAITELSGSPEFKASLGEHATIILFILGIIGMFLRKHTTKALAPVNIPEILKKKKKEPVKLNPLEQALKDDNDEMMGEG